MNLILFRYFFFHITRVVTMVLLVLIGLFFVLTLLDSLGENQSASFLINLRDTLLQMPRIIHSALPASAALGSATAIALLDSRRELALFRLIGIKVKTLLAWTAIASTIWVAFYFAFNEIILPKSAAISREIEISRSGSLITSNEDIWIKTSNGFAKLSGIAANGNQINGVWLFEKNQTEFTQIHKADKAIYQDNGWHLFDVNTADLQDDNSWKFSKQAVVAWNDALDPHLLAVFSIPPENLPIVQLINLSASLEALEQNTSTVDIVIWSRVIDTLMITILMMAGLLFARYTSTPGLASVRSVVALALLAVLSYYYYLLISRQFALDINLSGFVGAVLPPLFVAIFLFFFVIRSTFYKLKLTE